MNDSICPHCAQILAAPANDICPECSAPISDVQQRLLVEFAREVVHFGHEYRELYEREDSDRYRFYLPQAPDWLAFISLAVLSGILGNASYDIVKRAVRRIVAQVNRDHEKAINVVDDAFLRKLDTQFREYMSGLEKVSPNVRAAILDEIMVDLMKEYWDEYTPADGQRDAMSDDPEQHTKNVQRWMDVRNRKKKPLPETFNTLWSRVRDDD
jgi:hypothetical protein